MGHFRKQCKSPKKKNEDDSTNVATEEVQDALLFVIDSPLNDWVLDSGCHALNPKHEKYIPKVPVDFSFMDNQTIGDFYFPFIST